MLHRLLLIADQEGVGERPLADVVVAAADALQGRLVVQFRERDMSDSELALVIRDARERAPSETILIVNNRAALASEVEIGLHLPAAAEAPLVRPTLLGRSVHDETEARRAISDGVDYAVVGTIFETASHPGRSGAGLAHLSAMVSLMQSIPCYAIGGMTAETARFAIEAGAFGVAARSAILGAADVAAAARELDASLPT